MGYFQHDNIEKEKKPLAYSLSLQSSLPFDDEHISILNATHVFNFVHFFHFVVLLYVLQPLTSVYPFYLCNVYTVC